MEMSRRFLAGLFSGICLLLTTGMAHASNLVVNGNFDTAVPLNATGGGWSSAGIRGPDGLNGITGGWVTAGGNPGPYFFLNYFGYSSPGPRIQQALTLAPGQAYDLTGDYGTYSRNNDPPGATNSFTVDVNGNIVFSAGPTPLKISQGAWSNFNVCFTALTSLTTLRLIGETNNSDNDFGIDNISVTARATPCGTPDTTPPTVSFTSPTNAATSVAIDSSIFAIFSEPIDASTVTTATFTLSGGITGTVTYSGSTARFTPSSNLAVNTTYTATITTGVKDVAGNAMAANYAWTFTTGTSVTPPPGPTVDIPTLSEWATIIMATLLMGLAIRVQARNRV